MADRPRWQALGPAQVRLTGGLFGQRARGQATGLRFRPLCEVVDEPYTVYFPVVSEG